MATTAAYPLHGHKTAPGFPSALGVSRMVVRALIVVNLCLGAGIAALLVASLVASQLFFTAMGVHATDAGLSNGMRLIMVIGIGATPLTHLLLTRLLAIVETVGSGDPFVADNASRLQTMAWALLGLEVLHLAVGAITAAVSTPSQPLDLDWNFSVRSWLAVLLLFVLARVFDHGTRLRDDLEGTV